MSPCGVPRRRAQESGRARLRATAWHAVPQTTVPRVGVPRVHSSTLHGGRSRPTRPQPKQRHSLEPSGLRPARHSATVVGLAFGEGVVALGSPTRTYPRLPEPSRWQRRIVVVWPLPSQRIRTRARLTVMTVPTRCGRRGSRSWYRWPGRMPLWRLVLGEGSVLQRCGSSGTVRHQTTSRRSSPSPRLGPWREARSADVRDLARPIPEVRYHPSR